MPRPGRRSWIHEGLSGIITRGINYWQSPDGKDRRLLFSINGYMQAIDARTGKSILSFGNNGIVDLREGLRRAEGTDRRVQSRTPGKIWKNLLIMGSAAGEAWVTPPGDIRAYDVVTGKRVWQFHTVPEPGEFGYDTWPKEAYKYVGGANNWGEMSIDEERGIVYVPTGSATYDFYGADRHGMNLFANCLLALDTRTGKRLWHFQTVHHDLWDLDNVSAPQLDHRPAQGQARRCGRSRWQDRFPLRLQPRHRRAALADRRETGTQERRSRRAGVADAALPDGAAAVREDGFHGRRREPVAAVARAVRDDEGAHRQSAERGAVHAAGVHRHRLDARQPGRIELGDDGCESEEGNGLRRQRQPGGAAEARRRQDEEWWPRRRECRGAGLSAILSGVPRCRHARRTLPGSGRASPTSPTAWEKTRFAPSSRAAKARCGRCRAFRTRR